MPTKEPENLRAKWLCSGHLCFVFERVLNNYKSVSALNCASFSYPELYFHFFFIYMPRYFDWNVTEKPARILVVMIWCCECYFKGILQATADVNLEVALRESTVKNITKCYFPNPYNEKRSQDILHRVRNAGSWSIDRTLFFYCGGIFLFFFFFLMTSFVHALSGMKVVFMSHPSVAASLFRWLYESMPVLRTSRCDSKYKY